jgi:translation elongation factor EF-G
MSFTFLDQMEENTGFSLVFPYHINYDLIISDLYHNPKYPDDYHTHTFEALLEIVYKEPKAFYLTEEDKKYYSEQEMLFIQKVIDAEVEKLNKGYEKVTLNLNDETMFLLNEYKNRKGLTFEEAVIDILEKMIESPNELKVDLSELE